MTRPRVRLRSPQRNEQPWMAECRRLETFAGRRDRIAGLPDRNGFDLMRACVFLPSERPEHDRRLGWDLFLCVRMFNSRNLLVQYKRTEQFVPARRERLTTQAADTLAAIFVWVKVQQKTAFKSYK